MKLNLEQIKAITKGAVEVTEEKGWFHFHRFTSAQRELYRSLRPQFNDKILATAGIRLSFETDSEFLRFDYILRIGSSRHYGYFDVYENGVLKHHFGDEVAEVLEGRGEVSLTPGIKKLEVHFPWSSIAELGNVELSDGAYVGATKKARRVIAFGDSITQGYSAIYPSLTYMSRLTDMLDAECFNKAIGGDKFFPELADSPDPVEPDLITVAYGTNDWSGCPREEAEEKCRKFYRNLAIRYPNARIFAITPIWRKNSDKITKFGAPLSAMAEMIASVCAELPNVTVIRGDGFVPWLEEFYEDLRLHPNDMGFDFYARNLYNALIPHLK